MAFDSIFFRNANAEDAKLLFEWANDPKLRDVSLNSEKIEWESHLKWLRERLNDSHYSIKIALNKKNENLGYIRFQKDKNEWFIHFYVATEHRGKGLGQKILDYGIIEFQKDNNTSLSLKALVLHNNKASAACFLASDFNQTGFTIIREKKFIIFTKKTYK